MILTEEEAMKISGVYAANIIRDVGQTFPGDEVLAKDLKELHFRIMGMIVCMSLTLLNQICETPDSKETFDNFIDFLKRGADLFFEKREKQKQG